MTPGEEREPYGAQSVDPDQLQPADTLDERGVADVLDEGYSPPDREPANLRSAGKERDDSSLEARLAAEVPEPDPYAEPSGDAGTEDPRAGRLVSPDAGQGEDIEKAALASDVGIDGAGASAEEAAVHLIEADVGPETE